MPYLYTYLNLIGKIQFFSVHVAKAVPGPCIFGSSYTFSFKVYTIGCIAFAVYVFVGVVLKCSQREKPWAQKALPGLPSFSAEFFDVLKCRFIDGQKYVSADLSIECSGLSSEYSALRAFAIFWVLFWACGLPLVTFALLRPVRSELRQFQKGDQVPGFQQYLKDF